MTREAELELEIARLREALEKCSIQITRLGYSANHADETLSTPPSTAALQSLIEKVERRTIERCAEVCEEGTALTAFQSENCYRYAYNRANAIRALPTGNLKLEDLL